MEDKGGGRYSLEDVRNPLYEAVEVGCNGKHRTNDRVRVGDGGGIGECLCGF